MSEAAGARSGALGCAWWSGSGRSVRRLRGSVLGLVLVGALVAGAGGEGLAQEDARAHEAEWRLTVRPHEMATATRTAQAGVQTVDGQPIAVSAGSRPRMRPPWAWVYVPQQCVGTRRCPLLAFTNAPVKYELHMADKYGMITAEVSFARADLDDALKAILRTFAIDPDRIALQGRCATGSQTGEYAAHNPDVFSRVLNGTGEIADLPVRSPDRKVEYFIGTESGQGNYHTWQLQKLGYPVTSPLQFRGHTHTYEEYDFMGRWLQESWAIPDPAARPVPYTFDAPPLLTTQIVARMTAFWTRFMQEPDSIRKTARSRMVRKVVIPVGKERVAVLMEDMAALTAAHPSVAAALRSAKLTPQQHDKYRAALVGAQYYKSKTWDLSPDSARTVMGAAPTAAVAKNVELMAAHPDEFLALEKTGMWRSFDDNPTD